MTRTLPLAFITLATLGFASVANAVPVTFQAALSGPAESPPNASLGTGFAEVTFDLTAHTMTVHVVFSGLTGTTTRSHIHCCTTAPFTGTAGVATETPSFSNLPMGVTSGSFDESFDMTLTSSYNTDPGQFFNNPFPNGGSGSVTLAEQALFDGAVAGKAYLNIHTSAFPGGEIRGFLVEVPEPSTLALFGFGLLGLGFTARKRIAAAIR